MKSFLKKLVYSTSFFMIILLFFNFQYEYIVEFFYSFFVSLINVCVGYYLVKISIEKTNSEFYTYVYGGMLIRMILVFTFSIYLIKSNLVYTTPYMLFLIFFYTLHQWIEISSLLKEVPTKKIQLN